MSKKTNEDMAGIVSEPKGAIPEVKPAKSLWPRPHETVRVEPALDPPREEAPPVMSPVEAPAVSSAEPAAEFSAGPEEGYRASEPRVEPEYDAAPPVSETEETTAEPAAGDVAEPDLPRDEPAARDLPAESREEEAPFVAASGPLSAPLREERHVSVLEAADRQPPALDDPRESRTGQFVAMAAGIVIALAIGAVGLVYGSSALGLNFGGGSADGGTSASTSAAPTPAANPEDIKAMEDRVAALQAEVERLRLEKEKSAAAAPAAESQPANPAAEKGAATQPGSVASIPGPTPAPNAVNAPPAPTSTPAPAPQAAAPAPASEPTPPAATANTAPSTETARTEPTPAPPAAAPPPAPKPKPPETARAEPAPPPPPSYQTQPTYQQPRVAASPEMPVLQNWAVRDVYNGIAVVQGGRGAPLEVEPGDELPGGNRVLAIRRLGGGWAVITQRGIISGD